MTITLSDLLASYTNLLLAQTEQRVALEKRVAQLETLLDEKDTPHA